MPLDHLAERQALENAFPGRSQPWYQAVQAIDLHESSYGRGWKNQTLVGPDGQTYVNRGAGSKNRGALQCGHSTSPGGDCGPNCFPNVDKHADGSWYQGCFKWYDTDEAALTDFVYVLTDNGTRRNRAAVEAALDASPDQVSADDIAQAMRDSGYFEATVSSYATAIANNAAIIAQALGEPVMVVRGSVAEGGEFGMGDLLVGLVLVGGAIALASYGVV